MTGFEAPVLAFLATMAGLAGPGRRDGVRGIGGVTTFGWCALLVAACSLGVSLWQVRRAELERAEVAALVNADVATAIGQLIGVLQILTMVPESPIQKFMRNRSILVSGGCAPRGFSLTV
jgi:hypothetical protein